MPCKYCFWKLTLLLKTAEFKFKKLKIMLLFMFLSLLMCAVVILKVVAFFRHELLYFPHVLQF